MSNPPLYFHKNTFVAISSVPYITFWNLTGLILLVSNVCIRDLRNGTPSNEWMHISYSYHQGLQIFVIAILTYISNITGLGKVLWEAIILGVLQIVIYPLPLKVVNLPIAMKRDSEIREAIGFSVGSSLGGWSKRKCWTGQAVWELCLFCMALGPLYIPEI